MDDDIVTAEPEPAPEPDEQQRAEDAEMDRTAGKTMAVGAIIIMAFTLVGKVMGASKELFIAYFFGKSSRTDAYQILFLNVTYNLYQKFDKLLRPTFLPEFVKQRREDGDEGAWRLVGTVSCWVLLVVGAVSAVFVAFPTPVVRFVAPELEGQELQLAVVMLRIMSPALVLFTLSVMPELTLQAYRRFALFAIAEASYRAGLLLVFIGLVALVWNPDDPTAIYTLAIGVLVGSALRLVVMVPGLRSRLKLLQASLSLSTPGMRTILLLMPPVLLGLAFSLARGVADGRFSSHVAEGAFTCLTYARKIPDLTWQMLAQAVSFVVLPFLSEWAVRGERDKLADALVGVTRALAFTFVPVSIGLMVLSEPVIRLVYQAGQFGNQGVQWSTLALFCYAPGLLFFALDANINHWFFALKDTKTPNYVGVACAALHIAIAYVGVYYLGGTESVLVGIAAVALALTISKSTKVLILYGLIRGRIGQIDGAKVAAFALKLAVATAAMGAAMYFAHQVTAPKLATFGPVAGSVKKEALGSLSIGFVVGCGVFLAAAAVLRIEELHTVVRSVTSRIKGKLKRGDDGAATDQ